MAVMIMAAEANNSGSNIKWLFVVVQWPSGLDAGFPIQGSCVQIHGVAPRLTQPFILPRLIK